MGRGGGRGIGRWRGGRNCRVDWGGWGVSDGGAVGGIGGVGLGWVGLCVYMAVLLAVSGNHFEIVDAFDWKVAD